LALFVKKGAICRDLSTVVEILPEAQW